MGGPKQSHNLHDLGLNEMVLLFHNLGLRFSLYELGFNPYQILLFFYL